MNRDELTVPQLDYALKVSRRPHYAGFISQPVVLTDHDRIVGVLFRWRENDDIVDACVRRDGSYLSQPTSPERSNG